MAGANPTDQQESGQWLINIKKDFANLTSLSTGWSICKVPCKLRDMNDGAYNPQIISIGPLHHGTHNVQDMQEHKWHYALSLLERTRDAEKTLDECGETILNNDALVRAYYPGSIKDVSSTDLAKMLLFDGCFILELLSIFSPLGLGYFELPHATLYLSLHSSSSTSFELLLLCSPYLQVELLHGQ